MAAAATPRLADSFYISTMLSVPFNTLFSSTSTPGLHGGTFLYLLIVVPFTGLYHTFLHTHCCASLFYTH